MAALVAYPTEGLQSRVEWLLTQLETVVPESIAQLQTFKAQVERVALPQLEEAYTHTFDFDPDCSLDLGWHLFGEQYGRGDFLVKMRDLLTQTGLPESHELPDHLTHVLQAYGKLDWDQGHAFSKDYILPSLKKLSLGVTQKSTDYAPLVLFITAALSELYLLPLDTIPLPNMTEEEAVAAGCGTACQSSCQTSSTSQTQSAFEAMDRPPWEAPVS